MKFDETLLSGRQIVSRSFGLSGRDREAFLLQSCRENSAAVFHVLSSLSEKSAPEDFLSPELIQGLIRAALEDPRLEPGQFFEHYEILSLLGRGGMGEVYLANDRHLERKVAIKILTRLYSDEPQFVYRLRSEAMAASALNHPNILTIHSFGEQGGIHYIVSEYVEGRELRRIMRDVSPTDAKKYAVQIGEALRAAHRAGIIHRDIKPENVIVRDDGYVKVLDFGLAQRRYFSEVHPGKAVERVKAVPGEIAGTVPYMSPEQLLGKELDCRTDIWSWGVLVYEMTCRELPFAADNRHEAASRILEDKPHPTTNSVAFNRILVRALEKDVTHRYQRIEDALDDLSRVNDGNWRSTPIPRANWSRWLVMSATTLFLMLPVATPEYRILQVSRLTRRGDVTNSAISALGNRVAYSSEQGNSGSLHVIELGSNVDHEQAHYEKQNIGITFSPDGTFLYYVLQKNGAGTLYRVPTQGGEPKEILDDIDSHVSFAPDGHRFAYERFGDGGMYIESSDFATASVLARIPYRPLVFSRTLDWTPDGRGILFGLYDELAPGSQKIRFGRLSVDTSKIEYGAPPNFVWIGRLVATSAESMLVPAQDSAYSPVHLYEVEWRSGRSRRLTSEAVDYLSVSSTRDFKKLAALEMRGISSVWLFTKRENVPITPAQGSYTGLSWAHDGTLLVGAESNGNRNLWRIDPATKAMLPVTEGATIDIFPQVASDGSIVFSSLRDHSYHIWRASPLGLNPQRLTADHAVELDPTFSPDGKTIFFSSDRDGVMSIWKLDVKGGPPIKVVGRASRHPDVSPDGRWLLCEQANQLTKKWEVAIVSSDDGTVKTTFPNLPTSPPDTHDQARLVRWTHDGSNILYADTKRGFSGIWKQSVNGGFSSQVTLLREGRIFDFAESPDGASIAYIKGQDGGDVDLISGSPSDFRQR